MIKVLLNGLGPGAGVDNGSNAFASRVAAYALEFFQTPVLYMDINFTVAVAPHTDSLFNGPFFIIHGFPLSEFKVQSEGPGNSNYLSITWFGQLIWIESETVSPVSF